MLPPYNSDEVAEAIMRATAAGGRELTQLTVVADDLAREWRIEARRPDGREIIARYPFSRPDGISVPAEIAAWFQELVAD